ncbi:hypothetical protein AMD27_09390 [Acinetobacter sp. TGL-Y2]|uniref:WG repeat-containing protein n=1 Tax=Acinetobacter sp. TGL-Y2 TaxID=1407071 RepID=UPI0007A6562A|nr:WG repeat-containing protein [Acinetobacter sp. TGL-Y2]AMW79080.1 hypothetical protein AMD27_09390 [Acinetobacter sp. TGL-Y2]
MAHRLNVYTYSHRSKKIGFQICEWKYEIPLLFIPLLSNPQIVEDQLYFDRNSGIKNLRLFYFFLEKSLCLEQHEDFQKYRQKVFQYLTELPDEMLVLNATDVFNLSRQPHEQQAQQYLQHINEKNVLIENAISLGNLDLLQNLLDECHYDHWLAVLEHENNQYGWRLFEVGQFNHTEVYIYQDHQHFGLKDKQQKIILYATYDEIWSFTLNGLAIVKKNDVFGLIDTLGQVVVQIEWDWIKHVDDHQYFRCVVYRSKYANLMDLKTGELLFNTWFTEITCFYNGYIQIQENEYFSILDHHLNPVIKNHPSSFEIWDEHIFFTQSDRKAYKNFYHCSGTYLGQYYPEYLRKISDDYILIKPIKRLEQYFRLLNMQGVIVFDHIQRIQLEDQAQHILIFQNQIWQVYDLNAHQITRSL